MPIQPGQNLLHYEIVEKIGEGGMGVVWKAVDTVLDRDVAIKVVREPFSADADRLARFEREAKVLATLNHPNIASIHGLHEAATSTGSVRFLAMELVLGENLSDRLARGPVPLEETLEFALQIAAALEAAHKNGIVHRDLKPANIQITPEDKLKVLDFGLARGLGPGSSDSVDLTQSPTLTQLTTGAGVIIGTAAYMSPEQARGKPVDECTDLWAFGVVLWEMLTGQPLFQGETVSDTLAAVLRAELNWDALPTATPLPLRRLLRRCLVRTADDRLHHAADARIEIQDALIAGAHSSETNERPHRMLPWVLAASLLVVVLALTGALVSREQTPSPLVMLSLAAPEGTSVVIADGPATLSPDGTVVAMVAGVFGSEQLAIRRLDSVEYRALPLDTSMYDPFWSRDGRYLGFFAGDGKLKKIAVAGGPVVELANTGDGRGGTWNEDGVIVFTPSGNGPLFRVSANGGDAVPVTTLDSERSETGHWRPHFLPDGRQFLYLAVTGAHVAEAQAPRVIMPGEPEIGMSLWVGSLDGDAPRQITGSFTSGVSYAPPGYLLFVQDRVLMARPFDLRRLAWSGEPRSLVPEVEFTPEFGAPAFSVSSNGVLAYHRLGTPPNRRLVWRDREGTRLSELSVPGAPSNLDLAPDGLWAAVNRRNVSRDRDIWIVDFDRGAHQRLTFSSAPETGPVWSPDGERIAYVRRDPGRYRLLTRAANGSGDESVIFEAGEGFEPVDWSPDGDYLLIEGIGVFGDLWLVPTEGGADPLPFVATPEAEYSGRFSPAGRWIAYVSTETGRPEIYVKPWPTGAGRWQISTDGGDDPRWRGDGKELFYRDADRQLMSVSVDISRSGTLQRGLPRALFKATGNDYEPSPDGQRFLFIESGEEADTSPATVVLNWPALLEDDD